MNSINICALRLQIFLLKSQKPQNTVHVRRRTAPMKTGVLQLHVRNCGTAFQLICNDLTLAFNDLNGY